MASPSVVAFLRAVEWFQMVEAFHTNVFAFDRRGRGINPAVADLELLVEALRLGLGKRSFPRGFWDPSGPSALLEAFQVSIAIARTEMAL